MSDIETELERCRDWIQAALDYGGNTHDFEDIVSGVMSGYMQFWPARDAAAVTEILTYPKKKVLNIFLAGGNMETIIDMNESAEYFAKANGCTSMTMAGRKGWSKVLKDKGYREAFTVLRKEI